MSKSEESQGVITSDYADIELPSHSIWSFLYPRYQRYENLTAFVCTKTDKSYTYKELTESSLRWAKELEKYVGYNSSEIVAIIMPNNIDYPIVELGIFAIGAVLSQIRYDFKPDIAQGLLKDVNAKVLVIDSSVLEKFKVIFDQFSNLKIFVRGSNEAYPEGEDLHTILYSNKEGLNVEKATKIDPEKIAVVTCSSGTTGKPKPIVLTHRSIINSIICATHEPIYPAKRAGNGFQDTMLAQLPYAHLFSLYYYTIAATSVGCRILDLDTEDIPKLLDVVQKYKARMLTFRAYMVDALLHIENVKEKLESTEVILNVGCPLNADSARKLKILLGRDIFITEGYGSSETGPAIGYPVNQDCLGTTGKLIPNVKARIVDVNTMEPILKSFTHGELQLQTPGIMKGYLNNPDATRDAFDGDWYRTGDVSYFDDDKYIYVIERYRDLIDFKGKKVLPSSIENVIKKHDAVLDVGVVAVPSKSGEEVAKAFIIRKSPVSEEEIIDFVKKNTEEHMWLQGGVKFVDTLPRNHLGKMLRKILREMDWTETSST